METVVLLSKGMVDSRKVKVDFSLEDMDLSEFKGKATYEQIRGKLRESKKRLSQNIYERGVDDAGFGRIRSEGDQALFGGFTTKQMKERLGVQDKRPLADFLPTLTIAAKNLATEMKIIMLKKRTCKENLQSLLNMWKIILLLETCLDKEELNRKIYQHRKILRNWNAE